MNCRRLSRVSLWKSILTLWSACKNGLPVASSVIVLAIVSGSFMPGRGASITSSIVPFPLYPTTGHPSSLHVTGARKVSRPRL